MLRAYDSADLADLPELHERKKNGIMLIDFTLGANAAVAGAGDPARPPPWQDVFLERVERGARAYC